MSTRTLQAPTVSTGCNRSDHIGWRPHGEHNYQATNWWWPTSVAFYGEELPGRGGTATRPFPPLHAGFCH